MKYKKTRIEAVALSIVLLGAIFLVPASSINTQESSSINEQYDTIYRQPYGEFNDPGPFYLDQKYITDDPSPLSRDDNDDCGYKRDAGKDFNHASALYPGEVVDDTPGRGRTGKLSSTTDTEDWYFFSVCDGQDIVITMTPPMEYDYDLGLWDEDEVERANSTNTGSTPEYISYTADYTGRWYMRVHYMSGSGQAQYSIEINLIGQNDAGSGDDAPDNFNDALLINPGEYSGYLDMDDPYDFYKFDVTSGQGIHFNLDMKNVAYLTDFDISLYNPSGEYVYEEDYYYDDELLYPADETGQWRVKIDIFPGWVDCPQPTEWDY